MFHARAQVAVWSVLIVARRLQVKVSRIEETHGKEDAEEGEEMKGDEDVNAKVQPPDSSKKTEEGVLLPVLPPEMWLLVMSFFQVSWWKTFSQQGRWESPHDEQALFNTIVLG